MHDVSSCVWSVKLGGFQRAQYFSNQPEGLANYW